MKRKPSPALVISIIALVVALGGTSYAAVKINGKAIKKGTISGKALKKNTLTGTQINESKLAKVPSAISADNALNSAKLGGLAPESFVQGSARVITHNTTLPQGTDATIIEIPGLAQLTGECNGSSAVGFTFKSLGSAVSFRFSALVSNTVAPPTGGTFDPQEFVTLPFYASPKFELSVWREADPDVAYEVSGAAIGCKASAVAVGHG
ncbi:MAG: hypothetical protein JHC98_01235 [Thermoleophilaceae bacterium]|nr:hypothetical protein [Thermoleophilaceae bacterium]